MTEWNDGIARITLPTPFKVGDVHLYVVKGDRLTLFDAGVNTEAAWEVFQHELKKLKLTVDDIEQVVLSHHHPDHVGLLHFLPQEVEVYGHPTNERWIKKSASFKEDYFDFFMEAFISFGIPEEHLPFVHKMKKTLYYSCDRSLTGELSDGETPPGMHGWQVIETLGHAQSHIMLGREKDGIFFGGDHLLSHISSNPLLEPPLIRGEARTKPQLQYNASLEKLLNYPIEKIYPGHGPNVYNIAELVDERLLRQHRRALRVKGMIEETPLTVFEISKKLFPKVYVRELGLTISETVAQLDYLQSMDAVQVTKEAGVLRFKAN